MTIDVNFHIDGIDKVLSGMEEIKTALSEVKTQMANDKAAEDAKITELGGGITDLLNKINDLATDTAATLAILKKKAQDSGIDLTQEIQQLTDFNTAIQTATATVTKADMDVKTAGQ